MTDPTDNPEHAELDNQEQRHGPLPGGLQGSSAEKSNHTSEGPDRSTQTANRIAILALGVSLFAAAFTGWQAFEAHKANQFQAQQADLTTAGNVLIAQASDYPITPLKGSSLFTGSPQVVVNLNHAAVSDVMVKLYTASNEYAGIEMIGDMPSCTEVNVTEQLPPSDRSFAATTIYYDTPDGTVWQRAYLGVPTQANTSPVVGSSVTIYDIHRQNIVRLQGCPS